MTADLPGGGDDQETLYTYGVVKGGSAGDSAFASGHLLQKVTYPDSAGGSDVVSYAYNAQGQLIWQKDQAGNVIEFAYDDSGRREHQMVTTLIGGFDGAVRRITSDFDDFGRVETVTQYDNASPGSGTATDQVKYTYDDWWNVTDFEQDHNGLVGAGGSVDDYEVEYLYDKATDGRRVVRQAQKRLIYNTTTIASASSQYTDGSAGEYCDEVSRVSNLRVGATNVVSYDYLGAGTVVGINHGEASIYSRLYSGTPGDYPDLDRFNRVITSAWTKDLGGGGDRDFYDVDIAYDRNSNITLVEDNIHVGWDAAYSMDGLNRLIAADRGTWGGSSIGSNTEGQVWDLDQAGNWQIHQWDLDGDGVYTGGGELNDDGSFNKANELTARDTDDDSSDDITLAYDAAGNLTDDGTYDYVYDAFGRLRQVKNQSSQLVEENWYNGLGYRIVVHNDVDGDGDVDGSDQKFHLAYDTSWRVVGEFRGTDTTPKAYYLHHNAGFDGGGGSSYIDAVIYRERDANGNGGDWDDASDGTLEERLYYCQNWRADVVALITATGVIADGARYSPYGVPFGMPRGDVDGDGDVDSGDTGAISYATPGDVRQDLDLDGDVDVDDFNLILGNFGATAGRGVLSTDKDDGVGNMLGYAGYVWSEYISRNHVRNRVYDPEVGRWGRRDPLGYVDGVKLYGYGRMNPVNGVDPMGTIKHHCSHGGGLIQCEPTSIADGDQGFIAKDPWAPYCNKYCRMCWWEYRVDGIAPLDEGPYEDPSPYLIPGEHIRSPSLLPNQEDIMLPPRKKPVEAPAWLPIDLLDPSSWIPSNVWPYEGTPNWNEHDDLIIEGSDQWCGWWIPIPVGIPIEIVPADDTAPAWGFRIKLSYRKCCSEVKIDCSQPCPPGYELNRIDAFDGDIYED